MRKRERQALRQRWDRVTAINLALDLVKSVSDGLVAGNQSPWVPARGEIAHIAEEFYAYLNDGTILSTEVTSA